MSAPSTPSTQTIDSTLATLMIALDRLSTNGEALLIGYTSSLERRLFSKGAPGEMPVPHIWKRLPLASLPSLTSLSPARTSQFPKPGTHFFRLGISKAASNRARPGKSRPKQVAAMALVINPAQTRHWKIGVGTIGSASRNDALKTLMAETIRQIPNSNAPMVTTYTNVGTLPPVITGNPFSG